MLSVVTTLYHSEKYVEEFFNRVVAATQSIAERVQIVFVWDGDPSRSIERIEGLCPPPLVEVLLVKLSRNFGHHTAILCGIAHAAGEEIVVIDIDLEEQPELIPEFVQGLRGGFDIVIAHQTNRNKDGLLGSLYWRLIARAADTRLKNLCTLRAMTRKYAAALLDCGDKDFFLGGLDAFVGFRKGYVPIVKTFKGTSTYGTFMKVRFFLVTVALNNPNLLITIASGAAGLSSLVLLLMCVVVVSRLLFGGPVGWASSAAIGLLSLSATLVSFTILSLYLSKIYLHVKNRPLWVLDYLKQIPGSR